MKSFRILLPALLAAFSQNASADSWKDESGHGRGHKHRHKAYKEEYGDGPCKVERKYKRNGDYKEERQCSGSRHAHNHAVVIYAPAPPAVVIEPGITIHGTVRIPH